MTTPITRNPLDDDQVPESGHLFEAEQVLIGNDADAGMRAIIVIDNTNRGPGFGGVRYHYYATDGQALAECRRLAGAMTLKHAAAQLPYGGAKAVIIRDDERKDRTELMRAFGRFAARLGDVYMPAVDLGTTAADMLEIARFVRDVECTTEDPAPWTALGVHAGIKAALSEVRGSPDLSGVSVAIQGVGHVGAELARMVAGENANLVLCDIDSERAQRLAAELGASVIANDVYPSVPCDVLAPCAIARTVNHETVGELRCEIIAGAANDVLEDRECGRRLAQRGITYVPDFLLNAGGVIHVHAARQGLGVAATTAAVERIGDRVMRVLRAAEKTGVIPLVAAERMALKGIRGSRVSTASVRPVRRKEA